MSISKQELITWVNTLPDASEIGVDDGGLIIQVVGDPSIYLEIGGLPEKEGSTVKPVAVCGICGRNDKDGVGDGGICMYCGGDHWVELEDFENPDLINYLETAAKNTGYPVNELQDKLIDLNK